MQVVEREVKGAEPKAQALQCSLCNGAPLSEGARTISEVCGMCLSQAHFYFEKQLKRPQKALYTSKQIGLHMRNEAVPACVRAWGCVSNLSLCFFTLM